VSNDGVSEIKVRGGQGGTIAYRHGTVRHADGEYVSGDAHTNSVAGFWMLVKTGIRGVYHSVSTKHLPELPRRNTLFDSIDGALFNAS
jgi:hypothetical protein